MKRLFFAVLCACSFAVWQQESAASEINIDFFYNTLSPYGSWVDVANYGYCWQPSVAVSNANWRPYSDGYWAYTDVGWTWVSYEDFGWATYHYGRWARLRDRGWFWIPGNEWGPAWVSWRTGGDYVGWAPLPPAPSGEVVYDGRPIAGDVDLAYDIGPLYYNFIDVRYIGEPLLRERIFDPAQNVGYVERTVNVTNITYNNSQVYNHGPDYNALSAYSARPIQRLALQREANAELSAASAQPSALTQVKGDKLVVAAPQRVGKLQQAIAPVVKEKIAQPAVERGWSAVGDEKAVAQLKQQIKTQDPKKIPPPSIPPKAGASVAPLAGAPPRGAGANSAPPSAANTPAGPSAATAAAPANVAPKRKNRRGPAAVTNANAPAQPAGPPPAPQQSGKGKRAQQEPSAPAVPPMAHQNASTPEQPRKGKRAPQSQPNAAAGQNAPAPQARGKSSRAALPARAAAGAPPVAVPPQRAIAPPPVRNAPPNPAAAAPQRGPAKQAQPKKPAKPGEVPPQGQ